RPANALRSRYAARAAVTDLRAPIPPLDRDRARRRGPAPGGLTDHTIDAWSWGSIASAADAGSATPRVGNVGRRGVGAPVPPPPRLRRGGLPMRALSAARVRSRTLRCAPSRAPLRLHLDRPPRPSTAATA